MPIAHFLLLTLIATLCLQSCKVDGEEHFTIHANGTLESSCNYQIPTLGISLEEANDLINYLNTLNSRHNAFEVISASAQKVGFDSIRIRAHVIIHKPERIQSILSEEASLFWQKQPFSEQLNKRLAAIIGIIQAKPSISNVAYRRTISLQDLLKGQLKRPELLGDSKFRYSLTTHKPCPQHNASLVSNKGNTLTWVMPLQEYIDQPFEMHAKLPIPWQGVARVVPWWTWFILMSIALLLLSILYKLWRLVRRK